MANLEDIMATQAATVGNDWGGLGAVSGPGLLALLQANRIRAAFPDNCILVELTRANGEVGVWRLSEAGVAELFL